MLATIQVAARVDLKDFSYRPLLSLFSQSYAVFLVKKRDLSLLQQGLPTLGEANLGAPSWRSVPAFECTTSTWRLF